VDTSVDAAVQTGYGELRIKWTKSDAIAELLAALSQAQGEIQNAKKDSDNPFLHSKYADLASCWDVARGPLSKHGLSVLQIPSASGTRVTVDTILGHSSGQWIAGELELKAYKEQKGGGFAESDMPQAIGSAITYARRYALSAMVGIAGEDDDAEAAMGRGNGAGRGGVEQHNGNGNGNGHKPQAVPCALPSRQVAGLIAAFREIGVSQALIESYLGHSTDRLTEQQFEDLKAIGKRIKDKTLSLDEFRGLKYGASITLDQLKPSQEENRGHDGANPDKITESGGAPEYISPAGTESTQTPGVNGDGKAKPSPAPTQPHSQQRSRNGRKPQPASEVQTYPWQSPELLHDLVALQHQFGLDLPDFKEFIAQNFDRPWEQMSGVGEMEIWAFVRLAATLNRDISAATKAARTANVKFANLYQFLKRRVGAVAPQGRDAILSALNTAETQQAHPEALRELILNG
jgi:hypothetical protein